MSSKDIIAWILRSILLVQIVSALNVLPRDTQLKLKSRSARRHIIDSVLSHNEAAISGKRRSLLLDDLFKTKQKRHKKTKLRENEFISPAQMEQVLQDERELKKIAQTNGASELLLKPYIEQRGRNDYLVLQSETLDPSVTVIPNSIYYDVQKKCVNWLDACTLQGIRSHLLQRVQTHYN